MKNKKRYFKFIPTFIVLFSFLFSIYICSFSIEKKSEKININSYTDNGSSYNESSVTETEQMLALWISYITLDMRNTDKSEQSFQNKFDTILKEAKKHKMNTLIVQVRPFGDSFYNSSVYPWSHLLTGTQGTDPNYDPLNYMVQQTHKEGLKIHAWINPYRLSLNTNPSNFSEESFYKAWVDNINSDFVLDYNGNKYLNPYYDEIQNKIVEGVTEIVRNYEIDGIQFDDYFYPTDDANFDSKTYEKYLSVHNDGTAKELMNWRKENVNKLISCVYSSIKNINPNVIFGISPQVNLQNNEKLSADICTWVNNNGYLDYICPQVYVNFEHQFLPFDKAANEWKTLVSNPNIKLYFGLAVYKSGNANYDNGTWLNSCDILKREIEYGKNLGINGFMFYDYEHIIAEHAQSEISNAMDVL